MTVLSKNNYQFSFIPRFVLLYFLVNLSMLLLPLSITFKFIFSAVLIVLGYYHLRKVYDKTFDLNFNDNEFEIVNKVQSRKFNNSQVVSFKNENSNSKILGVLYLQYSLEFINENNTVEKVFFYIKNENRNLGVFKQNIGL